MNDHPIEPSNAEEQTKFDIKHLEMIQGVINRLSQNSFLFKGWTTTLAAAVFAVAVKQDEPLYLWIGVGASVLFWILDGYYLWQERAFRALYDFVRLGKQNDPFSMNTKPVIADVPSWVRTCLSMPLALVYGLTLSAFIATIITLKAISMCD